MLRSLRTWLHDRDPLAPLAFEAPLAAIKAKVAAGEPYFENLIRRQFVDNPHRTVMILKPDRDQAEREAKEEEARLAEVRGAHDAAETSRRWSKRPTRSSASRRRRIPRRRWPPSRP